MRNKIETFIIIIIQHLVFICSYFWVQRVLNLTVSSGFGEEFLFHCIAHHSNVTQQDLQVICPTFPPKRYLGLWEQAEIWCAAKPLKCLSDLNADQRSKSRSSPPAESRIFCGGKKQKPTKLFSLASPNLTRLMIKTSVTITRAHIHTS